MAVGHDPVTRNRVEIPKRRKKSQDMINNLKTTFAPKLIKEYNSNTQYFYFTYLLDIRIMFVINYTLQYNERINVLTTIH